MPQALVEKAILESEAFGELPTRESLGQFHGPRISHFTQTPLPRLFEEQAAKAPERVALTCAGQSLTYGELNARANQLARHLRALGFGRESLVGICIDRTLDMAVGILGILKSGAAYLPLDPDYPAQRLAFMLQDARPSMILTRTDLAKHIPEAQARLLIDSDWPTIAENADANLSETPAPSDLAYVIYTSGSTGEPKGVMIEHGNLANYLLALNHELGISGDDNYLHTASIAFSSSRRQLFLPLSQGATVVLATSDERKDPLALFQMIKDSGVTVMDAVPSFWRICTQTLESLSEEARQTLLDNRLRLMLSASEPLLSDIPRTWRSRFGHPAHHVHMFGQTETAGIVCLYHIPSSIDDELNGLPIGRPIANSEIYILDPNGRPCAVDVAGELYIGGAGVGRGYLDRSELTAEKFVPHPFAEQGGRLYRTGDWARCRADGQIAFAGRRDQQVKLRGFRVELGEVETALAKHPSIRESVVVARQNERAGTRLIAYFVSDGSADLKLNAGDLRSFLSARLPEHEIPSVFVRMDAMPLSANGKVNRLALPEPDDLRSGLSTEFVAPQNEIETRLAAIWSQVLRVEGVGRDDNFFELGGHSLLAAQIVSRVCHEFKIQIALRILFEAPTLAQIAEKVVAALAMEQPAALPQLQPVERGNKVLLSFAQQRLWFMNQLEPGGASYNIRRAFRIRGALDVGKLQCAVDEIVKRHEVLRTNFVSDDGQPLQVISPSMRLPIEVTDLSGLATGEREVEVRHLTVAEGQKAFDLTTGPLCRIRLVKLAGDDYLLLLTIHHIISDGWSIGVLLNEVTAVYQSFSTDQNPQVPELQIQYADFALWQRSWLQGEMLESQLAYWREQLRGAPAALDLPTDYPRPAVQSFRGAQESVLLSKELSDAIKTVGQQEGVTLFMTLLAAFQTLLLRYSGQDDIVVGSPIAGRTQVETEALIGFFVNTLVLRTDLSGNPSFRELLGRTREAALGAYTHQDVPFEKLVAELHPERSLDRTPLFQVMFALQNAPVLPQSRVDGMTLTPVELSSTTAKFDLSLSIFEATEGLRARFEYSTDLFASATIERMLGHLRTILEEIVRDPTRKVGELPLLTPTERRTMLVEWNQTEKKYERDRCVHQLFEQQAALTPGRVAVVFENQQLTYAELNARANQVAHYLRKFKVGPSSLIGICVERSLEMIVGLLGILKTGTAYVPLDPAFPKERLAFMADDAKITALLTQQHLSNELTSDRAKIICLDSDWKVIGRESIVNPNGGATAESPAYVIYTSGSTGKPKGVQIGHQALTNFLCSVREEPGLTFDDILLSVTTLSFDIAALELYLPLIVGARLVIASREVAADGGQLQNAIINAGATVMQATPATWRMLIDAGWKGGRDLKILCGGEALSRDLANQLLDLGGSLWNMYGPTETTIWSLLCEVKSKNGPISIGRPIANTEIFLLDPNLEPVPAGVAGELHIGGDGLAHGYLNRPELTAERFIRHPFRGDSERRLYKTGDLARYRSDGSLEYLGRIDDQVKLRGFRIELGEIESVLRQHAAVHDSVVVARDDLPGDKRLVAYVVSVPGETVDGKALRLFLQEKLPEYMIPSAVVELHELPLTPNGKVNRRALPAPDYNARFEESYVAPRTPVEDLLAGIWAEVLKISNVGVNDNFFELGGHSLLATQVTSRVLQTFGAQLPLRALLEAPTVAGMAERIEALREDTTGLTAPAIIGSSRNDAAPLSFGQQSLWFLDSLTPNSSLYNVFRAVRLRGQLNVAAFQKALDGLVERHDSLRTIFKSVEGQPVQVVVENQKLVLSEIDLTHFGPATREPELQRLLQDEAHRPFDLARGPLVRAMLFILSADERVLLLSMHHIVADDWSLGILSRDLKESYNSLLVGRSPELPELPIQYADYALWQRECLQNGLLDTQLDYWKQQLAGAPALLELPTDRPRPSTPTFFGARHTLMLTQAVRDQLVDLSRREGVTLFMTLLAAFQILLARHSGQDHIVVGSPIAGRNRIETENLIGYFVNTLVLRTSLAGNPTFRELLGRVREVALGAYGHQETPFEKLVEELQPERSLTHSPLFQTMFIFQNAPASDLNLDGLFTTREKLTKESAPLDLTLEARETSEGLRCVFEYKTDLFDPSTIARMAERFQRLLESATEDPAQRVDDLPLLSEAERHQLLVGWNDNRVAFPSAACIHQLFEAQVERTPNAIAAEFQGAQLAYCELNARANRLAHYLRKQGVGPDVLVGICVERSLEMLVGLLGILKAGGAYVPLDPAFPKERLAFMIADAEVSVLLSQQKLVSDLPTHQAKVVCLDSNWEVVARESAENPIDVATGENLAYVIYTSGSTGKPKGVQIGHRALTNFLCSVRREPGLDAADVLLAVTTLSFDIAALEIYLPLITGASLVIASREVAADGIRLAESLMETNATVMQATPATWKMLIDAGWQGSGRLKILCGGEALSRDLANHLLERGTSLWNMYGPTETTIWSTMFRIERGSDPISIGRPLANTQVYILDKKLNPVPVGIPGELHIGGEGLARGYLNRPELSSEKFIYDPFSSEPHARIYKTGDLARYLPDGKIECLGRVDDQVKIRGFRIELGEIESILRQHTSVRETVVIARESLVGDKAVVAYVIAADDTKIDNQELRRFLQEKLPSYMIPSVIVELTELPLTPNGKVNRRALPAPDYDAQSQANYVAPRTPVEELLAGIWAEVLRISSVGVNDNFFELGGHSLLATQVISRIRNAFKLEMPLRLLFERPTVALMAEAIQTANIAERGLLVGSIECVEHNGTAPLSFTQQQFWLLDQAEPNSSHYNVRTAIRIAGPLDVPRLQKTFEAILVRHEILRTTFVLKNGSPVQVVAPWMPLTLGVLDFSRLSASEHEIELQSALTAEAEAPFDLAHGPLLRIKLVKFAEDEHVLLVTVHHIICDAWSIALLRRELATIYQLLAKGESFAPRLQLQYADFALWQRSRIQGKVLEEQLDYWKRQLASAPATIELPTDYPQHALQTFNGAQESLVLSPDLSHAIKTTSRREGTTLFMTLLAAFQALLFRYGGQDDVVVGSPVAGRTLVETENVIGAFVNTVVFRGDLSGNPTFREFLGQVRETALEAYAHQELPFERLVEELRPDRVTNRTPLFQVMFALQNTSPELAVEGLTLTALKLSSLSSKFDLTLEVEAEADDLRASLKYNTDLFAPATIHRMLMHLQRLLETVVVDPEQRVADISLLSDAERQQLLVEWNDNRLSFPRDLCIHHLFEAQAAKTPDAIAAEFQGDQLTYRELNARANRLAHYLRKQGVDPEVRVGVCIGRSLDMLIGILGVLKAGGAYVPLDPTYPRDRIAFMIEDAELLLVLTRKDLAKDIPGGAAILCIDEDWETIAGESDANPLTAAKATNVAYVIYTSGSTGNPKGVMIEHRSLVNFTVTAAAAYQIGPADRVLQFASLSFDLSVEEIYPALTHGATIVLRTDEMISSARDFMHYSKAWGITVLDLPTAYWHELSDALHDADLTLPEAVRLVVIGGEKAAFDRVVAWHKRVRKGVRLVNTYGPTETTVAVTMCDLRPEDQSLRRNTVPIGRPLANATAYVLDESLKPVPIGAPGELYIGGPGVARGYVKQPELTNQKFIQDPFSDDHDSRLYRTGDLVRYRPDGAIEFLGRIDNQIKIRGFRVELEEIEQALRTQPGVADCVVALHEASEGDKRLFAYVVPIAGWKLTISELRNYLKTKLPSYMMPAAFELIDALPLSPSGKINRRALPAPRCTQSNSEDSFVAPRTPLERLLAVEWCEVLKLERIGIHDNFFELGGHSLLAAKVVSRVRANLEVNFGMVDLFQAPTIATLAALLFPRGAAHEPEAELAALLGELDGLTDEEAQLRFDREIRISEAAIA